MTAEGEESYRSWRAGTPHFGNRRSGARSTQSFVRENMTTVNLKVSASPGDTVQSYWITIHDKRLRIVDDKGAIDLEKPGKYIVVWHFIGNEGATLGIRGEVNGQTVMHIKQSKIPAGEVAGAGIARIEI
jgi:hypothetical protein